MTDTGADRLIRVALWQDLVILAFILLGVSVLYPLYSVNGHALLLLQLAACLAMVFGGGLLRRKLAGFLDRQPPFVDEILTFSYVFVALVLISLLVPYFYNASSINPKVLYFGVMASLLFGMIYFIRVYPSFRPGTRESHRYLVTFTLEILKLGITLWILFFILTGVYVIFGGDVRMDNREVVIFFVGMMAYTVCVLGFLTRTYFGVLKAFDEREGPTSGSS